MPWSKNREKTGLRDLQDERWHDARLRMAGEMSAGLAHELTQPLTSALNYLRAARDQVKEGPGFEQLEKAIAQLDRGAEIITRLRDFLRRKTMLLQKEDLNDVVEKAVVFSQMDIRAKRMAIHRAYESDLPRIAMDRITIEQVIVNLMRNAGEAMEELERPEVTIATHRKADGFVEISVADCGPGLAREIAQDPFRGFETTKTSGLGIGLKISRAIVEAHDGVLDYAPNTLGGATFRFSLPIASVERSYVERSANIRN